MAHARDPLATPATLLADLHTLGVRAGDIAMVHASLRRLGPVQGGAAGVVAALDAAFGPDGLWLMVLGAQDDHAWVNERPEAERVLLLTDAEPFDPLRTPAQADVGKLAEVMRQSAGTVVSDHPEGRFGARGALATQWMASQPWHDYYGPGSPLQRLCEAGGRVLRLGADDETVTALHYAEYLADLPHKRRVRRHRKVLGPTGPLVRVVECLDDCDGIVDWNGSDYFGLIVQAYRSSGKGMSGRVGQALAEVFDAADVVAFGRAWMEVALRRCG